MKIEETKLVSKPDINSSRRILLRNVFAAGCALCLPVACGAESQSGRAQPEAPKPAAAELEAAATPKKTKAQAKYQDTPNGKQKCSACAHFVAPKSCKLVEGDISPDGWCMLFTPKPA